MPVKCSKPCASGMVFCDRHYGGINYPVGGVGRIAEELAEGLRERGGHIEYRANVRPCKRLHLRPML